MELFRVVGIPDMGLDRIALLDIIGGRPFALKYDLGQKSTYLCLKQKEPDKITHVETAIPGLKFEHASGQNQGFGTEGLTEVHLYRDEETIDEKLMADIFDMKTAVGSLYIVFTPRSGSSIEKSKRQLEKILGGREVSRTMSTQKASIASRLSVSMHRDNFEASEDTELLTKTLESLNESILRSDRVYSIKVFIESDALLKEYVSSKFLVLSMAEVKRSSAQDLLTEKEDRHDILFGLNHASKLVNFYGKMRVNYKLQTVAPFHQGNVLLGTFIKDGVFETDDSVYLNALTMNLGVLITGLPGSGKSVNTMHILESVHEALPRASIVVISPSEEWNGFAAKNHNNLVRLYDGTTPINFFRCPANSDKVRFYEDLAMILASASNAGPYQKPLEKCLLNAFSRVYKDCDNPDPAHVYMEIEESVIRFHGKKSSLGVKYTKHGENIRSALENLRRIASRPEYSCRDGIKIEELLGEGIVFDMSLVSNSSKPYLYALILNQMYSITSKYNTEGDAELRVLMCLEEAHLVFKDRNSAAVTDLQTRIQDFRKRGIGLMLLTQNPLDIEPSIRRLCQTKMYFKQAPDVAAMAAKDMLFANVREDTIESKLKRLDSRTCAFSGIARQDDERRSNDTVFVKTVERQNGGSTGENPLDTYIATNRLKVPQIIETRMDIEMSTEGEKGRPRPAALKVIYFGEVSDAFKLSDGRNTSLLLQMYSGVTYTVQVLDVKGRIIKEAEMVGKPDNTLRLEN
jgi:hypothetical protein